MTKVKHHGAITKKDVENVFKKYGFNVVKYSEDEIYINVIVRKDYSKKFNIEFNGIVEVKCSIVKRMYDAFCVYTYPTFKEITNLIPKDAFYHVYSDGNICYAPPKRPLVEKWRLIDFINSVDSFFYNYFSIEYIGTGKLFQLEHGDRGLMQYEYIYRSSKNKE